MWVWLPVVIALAVIARESTNTFSSEHTSGWLRPLFEKIFGPFADGLWAVLHFVFRKCGHFIGYGLVCLTWVRAWLLTLARNVKLTVTWWRLEACVYGACATSLVALCDEWHQTHIPSRTGLFSDVMLDTLGATVMCGVIWVICWQQRFRRGRGKRVELAAASAGESREGCAARELVELEGGEAVARVEACW